MGARSSLVTSALVSFLMVLGWPELPNQWARQKRMLLCDLCSASIVAPNGRSLDPGYASRFGQVGTSFDLTDPDTGAMLPGSYHFEFEGITVAGIGPRELTWDLREP
ncbi:MAG: hypothetical protein PVH59_02435 [Anaerolineae bacterium]|jgi:hypothetical protein